MITFDQGPNRKRGIVDGLNFIWLVFKRCINSCAKIVKKTEQTNFLGDMISFLYLCSLEEYIRHLTCHQLG